MALASCLTALAGAAAPAAILLHATLLPAQQERPDSLAPSSRLNPAQEARVQSLEARLKCPVCRTQSVLESTSFMALEMRSKIREMVAAGEEDGEVLQYFADRYGDYILLEPRKRGFGLSAYAMPLVTVLAGGVLLLLALRRARRRSVLSRDAPPAAVLPPSARDTLGADDRARVDEELRRYTS